MLRRVTAALLVAWVFAACGGSDGAAPDDDATHYAGSAVSFDVPPGWHTFDLQLATDYFAAYGPVEGSNVDYVSVAPLGEGIRDQIAMLFDAQGGGTPVDVNGLPSEMVTWTTKDGTWRSLTQVRGETGTYLIACQAGPDMRTEVSRGCDRARASLEEPVVTDASGCTDRELALLASVPVPEGASAHEPTVLFSGALRSCDLMVELPANDRDDVLGELHSALADDGWDVSDPVIDRRWNDLDVWAFVAERSPDTMLVEVYSGDGVSDHYFLTAVPGHTPEEIATTGSAPWAPSG